MPSSAESVVSSSVHCRSVGLPSASFEQQASLNKSTGKATLPTGSYLNKNGRKKKKKKKKKQLEATGVERDKENVVLVKFAHSRPVRQV